MLMSRKRVKKGMKRMKCVPCLMWLFTCIIRPYREIINVQCVYLQLPAQVLDNAAVLVLYLRVGLLMLCQKVFDLHVTLTREATLCLNILSAVQKFVQVSKFLCFYDPNKHKTKWKEFSTTWQSFEYFLESQKI